MRRHAVGVQRRPLLFWVKNTANKNTTTTVPVAEEVAITQLHVLLIFSQNGKKLKESVVKNK